MAEYRHPSVPRYAPFGEYCTFELRQNAYKARDLLNLSVKSFYSRQREDLNSRQIEARDSFIEAYKQRKDLWGGKQAEKDGSVSDIRRRKRDVGLFMTLIDDYYFFGLLREHHRVAPSVRAPRTDSLTGKPQICSTATPTSSGKKQKTATSTSNSNNKKTKTRLRLSISADGRRLDPLDAVLGRLVHEAVHAWFRVFACHCDRCERDALNTTGAPGDRHGPLFLMLHGLVVDDVRRWDVEEEGLRGFALGDAASARARDDAACDELDDATLARLNPRRSRATAAGHLVRLTEDDEVQVRDKVMHNQMLMEDALRIKRGRRDGSRKQTPG
ncbi:hypothetical protein F4779DRAFT_622694 [Xylariaceae sp. FL0662B]|nr:hypothetical protein F4779DRAFT_622694 [Xylariaceae sp. FL0662B]